MPDLNFVAMSIAAGALSAGAVFVACGGAAQRIDAVGRGRVLSALAIVRALHVHDVRARLEIDLERAGWHESPERVTVFAIALSASLALLGASTVTVVPSSSAAAICIVGI